MAEAIARSVLECSGNDHGMHWDQCNKRWHVRLSIQGTKFNHSFRPQDRTQAELERTRLLAVRCRDALLQVRKRAMEDSELDVARLIAEVKSDFLLRP